MALGTFVIATAVAHSSAVDTVTCDIQDHGADSGKDDNTAAITAAIKACSGPGGGTVVVSGGASCSYKTGPLEIAHTSGVVISLPNGGSLEAAFGPDNWPQLKGDDDVIGGFEPFLRFLNCSGCGVTGSGTVWGKGGRSDSGGFDWWYKFDQGKIDDRPELVVVEGGSNFRMSGITLLDSPAFNVHLYGVAGAEFSHINITANWYTDPDDGKLKEPHNTDGIDPDLGSSNIWIHDSFIHNGDDCIAVKAGVPNGPCTRNVLVENCQFELGHGASIGSVGSGCVENVVFRGISMNGLSNGCRLKTHAPTDGPGRITNITWQDITMKNLGKMCVSVTSNYDSRDSERDNYLNDDNTQKDDDDTADDKAEHHHHHHPPNNITDDDDSSKTDDDDTADDKAEHHHHHHHDDHTTDDDDSSKHDGGNIQISKLQFINIKGNGCAGSAEFVCTDANPCKGISLSNFHVDGGDMNCNDAFGTANDCDPDSCLKGGN
eukprot:CAMPEP_0182916894 /NCGR_PEP_ID=MMETSP0105_2-20130417/1201_1 /TAXON_ID=81532 ORGANISM="Acanthoeca-like sp., Strain 10tr" /NCGR_SAMPLE_ID=MMETSP0105_2 /ASSEMBLY_ACC=CAM_ASM_000205 /LENGTH=488 /DNA_ID=CAMNT_0025053863 /DNA_START=89 /DNA_END=1555 /DNA_ORIENTATION=+